MFDKSMDFQVDESMEYQRSRDRSCLGDRRREREDEINFGVDMPSESPEDKVDTCYRCEKRFSKSFLFKVRGLTFCGDCVERR